MKVKGVKTSYYLSNPQPISLQQSQSYSNLTYINTSKIRFSTIIMRAFLILLFLLAQTSVQVIVKSGDPLTTVSPILGGAGKTVVEIVVSLIAKGYECSIAPLNSSDVDQDDLKVFCDSDHLTCFSCTLRTSRREVEEHLPGGHTRPVFSMVSRSVVKVVTTLMKDGNSCGVTSIQANRINITGVKTLCESNFCFLCENRDILKSSQFEANVLRISANLFSTLSSKTSSGHSCGVTTSAIKNIKKVGDDAICDENVCIKCNKESAFDLIPESLKSEIVKVTKEITNNVKALIADKFSCGVTKQESTEIDSENLKIVCKNKLCFLCKKPGDKLGAILDVETVAVSDKEIIETATALEEKKECRITFEVEEKFQIAGLVTYCSPGVCFICEA